MSLVDQWPELQKIADEQLKQEGRDAAFLSTKKGVFIINTRMRTIYCAKRWWKDAPIALMIFDLLRSLEGRLSQYTEDQVDEIQQICGHLWALVDLSIKSQDLLPVPFAVAVAS